MTPAVPTSIAVMQNSDGASTLSALTLSEVWASSPTWQVGILRAPASEQEVCSCFHTDMQPEPLYSQRPLRLPERYGTPSNAQAKGRVPAHVG